MKTFIVLLMALSSQAFAESTMNLFIARTPHDLNWDTPSTLATTLLKNSVSGAIGKRKITLGHVNFELKCDGKETLYAGMHYLNKSEGAKLIFDDGSGLGLLFHNMAGRFDTKADIEKARKDFDNGKTSIISFKMSDAKCGQLSQYITNYLSLGEQYNYGLNNNPFLSSSKLTPKNEIKKFTQNEKGIPLGAGCTAFVVSALQEIGIYDTETINQWFSKVKVPEEFIGQYSDQIYKNKDEIQAYKSFNKYAGKKVSISKIIRKAHEWAKEDEAGLDIIYYSPNLMFSWIESIGDAANFDEKVLSGKLVSVKASPKKRKQQAYHLTIALDK